MRERHKNKQINRRPRSRKFKRKIKNLIIETLFLILLIFVAIKFVKSYNEMPKVSNLSVEEQKKIIEEEMKNGKGANSRELAIETTKTDVKFTKVILTYGKNNTIISIDIEGVSEEQKEHEAFLEIYDENQEKIKELYINIPILEKEKKTRLNFVLEGDFSTAEKIKVH